MTGDLILRTRYWDDPQARAAFKDFIREIHGLDFTEWEAAGYWDDAYTPFSYFHGDTVVASACIYLLDFVIDGARTCLAQISAVGTRPNYRRRGLSSELTDIGLEWAQGRHDGVFLFADEAAVPFYTKCGFVAVEEYVETVPAGPVSTRPGAVRLDPGIRQDRDTIFGYAKRRTPVSDKFGVCSARLFMFHALYSLRTCAYEIKDLGCLVFLERTGDCLRLYDIVGERIPRFAELHPYIADPSDRVIEFHFGADQLGLDEVGRRRLEGNYPFVKSGFPVEDPVFPFTSRA